MTELLIYFTFAVCIFFLILYTETTKINMQIVYYIKCQETIQANYNRLDYNKIIKSLNNFLDQSLKIAKRSNNYSVEKYQ